MNEAGLDVLLVEDNPADVLFLRDALAQDGLARFRLTVVESLAEATETLAEQSFAAVLLDLGLPDSRGLETFLRLHHAAPEVPVVVLSALDDEEVAMHALQAGAQDYLVKRQQDFPIAGRALRYAIERNRLQETLQESERRFSMLFHLSPVPVGITRAPDFRIVDVNDAWVTLTGYTRDEAIGKTSIELGVARPETLQQVRAKLEDGGEVKQFEIPLCTRAGEERRILISSESIELGDQRYFLNGLVDITERKQAQDELERTRNTLAQAQRIAHLGSFEYIAATNSTVWSEEEYYIYGLDPAESSPTYDAMLETSIHPDDAALLDDVFMRALRHNAIYELEHRIVRPDGSVRWVYDRAHPYLNEQGELERYIGTTQDITERKQAEQNLRESEEKYRLLSEELEERVRQRTAEVQDLYDTAPAGYHSLDTHGNFIQINQTQLNWSGYTRDEILGHSFGEFLTAESRSAFEREFPIFKACGFVHDKAYEMVRKDGTSFPVLVNATAIYDADGNFVMSRTTVFDNTEHKQAEQAIRESEAQVRLSRDKLGAANVALEKAARMKDEFLANMSHELRTPLTGILGLSEAMQLNAYGPLTERQEKAVRHIEESGRHLLDLINDILDLSKVEAGMLELNIEPVALSDVCQASLLLTRGMAHRKSLTVRFAIEPPTIRVRADARRLKQMLVNLLSNAIKFTPENGSLGLEVQGDEGSQAVRLTVWDKGIGIAPENLEKLFQPFVQLESSLSRQYEGTGLGLSLVQRMAELHGGSVQVESALGEGSRFTVLLPWIPEAPRPTRASPRSLKWLRNALVVEDTEIDAEQLTRYLESLGMEVIVHNAGQGAMERAAHDKPDVILLDLHLPDRSGLDVLAELKDNPATRNIPVLFCSVEERRSQAMSLGAAGYLVKPLSLPELRAEMGKVADALGQHCTANPSPDASRPLVLIADDNEIVIDLISDFLDSQNFLVATARSGVELLEAVADLLPDIILMDIQMPVLDGLEATRRIRVHPDPRVARVPIITLTALAMTGDRERCLAAGANEYMSKPVELRQLVEIIRNELARQEHRAA